MSSNNFLNKLTVRKKTIYFLKTENLARNLIRISISLVIYNTLMECMKFK